MDVQAIPRRSFRQYFFVLLALWFASIAMAGPQPAMNVIFVLVDDLGWSDLGCYGSDFYETPNIDALAGQSLKFTQAYAAAPVCSPTRAAIMTGKSPARLDMTIWHEGAVDGGPKDRKLLPAKAIANLPREETTLAEMFQQAGYFTAHIGKWHLGTAAYYPEAQGFDINIGGTFWGAPATFFHPFSGKWNQRDPEIRYVPGLGAGNDDDYLPDRLTDAALDVIESQKERTFFLSLWYYAVHSPIEAPKPLVDHFHAKPSGKHQKDPNYAAMVNRVDYNVGRVLNKLKELKISDRTIVVFTSDNGGVDFDQRSIVPTSNLPLRSGKGTLYEGGIRVPLLIHGPNMQTDETSELCTSQDFFPTFLELLKRSNSALQTEIASPADDGVSLMPLLDDATHRLPSRSLFWHFPHYYPRMTPGSAIRDGDWKLLHFYENDHLELYDLRNDPGEHQNLATTNTEKTRQLFGKLKHWRAEVGANSPMTNPN